MDKKKPKTSIKMTIMARMMENMTMKKWGMQELQDACCHPSRKKSF